jgi:putative transcriptional regulator
MDQAPNRLREFRLARHLSQQALADKINTSKVTVHSLEIGKMQLTFDYARRIAKVFGVTAIDLFNPDDQNEMLRAEEMELLRRFREADPGQQEMIMRVAEPRESFIPRERDAA